MEAGPSSAQAGPSTSRAGPATASRGGSNAQAGPSSRRRRKNGNRDRNPVQDSGHEVNQDAGRSAGPSKGKGKAKAKDKAKVQQQLERARQRNYGGRYDNLPEGVRNGPKPVSKKTLERRAASQKRIEERREKEREAMNEIDGSFADLDFEILDELGSGDADSGEARKGKERMSGAENPAAAEESGPSRSTASAANEPTSGPSSYTPLRRSVLAGMKLSPDPSTRHSTPPASSSERRDPPNDHFDPPNLFSASLPVTVESSALPLSAAPNTSSPNAPPQPQGLLLPSHVILGGMDPISGETNDASAEDEEGLFFLDEDTTKNVQRYFDPTAAESVDAEPTFLATADQSKICKKCKRPGHRAEKCPHVVCDICGVMDEHEKSQCKFGMKCFKCGERGHRREDCRNRPMSGCPLCGSRSHIEMSCPRHWRIYSYRTVEARQTAIEEKENLTEWHREAAGGSSREQWCYNCAREGHFGDDCNMRRGSVIPLETPSPFSYEISSKGPFAQSHHHPRIAGGGNGSHTRFNEDLPDLRPEFAGLGAGQKGKQKAREESRRAERSANVSDDDDDDDDPIWVSGGDRLGAGSSSGGAGHGRGTPMRYPLPPRPWDSERRDRTPQQNGKRGSSMPFGHGHLMSAGAPRSSGSTETHWTPHANGKGGGGGLAGKGISFGKISLPATGAESLDDTPTHGARGAASTGKSRPGGGNSIRGGGGSGKGAAATLVARALGNSHTPSRNNSTSLSASPLGAAPHTPGRDSPASGGSAKKKRKSGDTDAWSNGNLGGNVAGWGREMDSAERESGLNSKAQKRSTSTPNGSASGLKIKGSSEGANGGAHPNGPKSPKSPKSPKGNKVKGRGSIATAQKYYGGY